MNLQFDFIQVRGAQEHNLKNVSLDVPKRKLVSFTGVSGSGKSSLVFDTIYVESFRRFADASQVPVFLLGNSFWSKTRRPKFQSIKGLPPALGLSQRQGVAGQLSTVGTISGISDLLRVYFAAFGQSYCKQCDIPLRAYAASEILSNVMQNQVGKKVYIIASIAEKRKGAFAKEIEKFRQQGFSKLRVNSELYDLQDDPPQFKIDSKKLNTVEVIVDFLQVTQEKRNRVDRAIAQALEFGKGIVTVETVGDKSQEKFNTLSTCPQCAESAEALDPRHFSHSSLGQCTVCTGTGSSVEDGAEDLYPCPSCQGSRLNAPNVKIDSLSYEKTSLLPLAKLLQFVKCNKDEQNRAKAKVLDEVDRLITTMIEIGLSHLALNRSGASLSPGELQRLRLASMLSNRLSGALYILDEPCQGLTTQEVDSLVTLLKAFVNRGATVVCVEHHPDFLKQCDQLVTIGPGAGALGGEVVSVETGAEYKKKHLSRHKLPAKLNDSESAALCFRKINIRNVNIPKAEIPTEKITILTGNSGQGKATFLQQIVFPALTDIVEGNEHTSEFYQLQNRGNVAAENVNFVRPGSMTRSSRKSVASALDIISPIRDLFARLPQSQILGLTEMHFSWNSKLGRCGVCEGRGYIELVQKFGAPVRIPCESCMGAKLNSRSLVPRFKGFNLADIMQMTLQEALLNFAQQKMIASKIERAVHFGLGYITLGQGMDELSGGELQRLMLTLELKRSQLTGSWFLLMHPGTGLHAPDIKVLGGLMKTMCSRGASFVLLENRQEFLEFADCVIAF